MTIALDRSVEPAAPRPARRLRVLMCRPDHFEVGYAINPWMDPTVPVDRGRAIEQWEALRGAYLEHGHDVELIDPEPGLPDMVFAANGGIVAAGRALSASFAHPERQPEGAAYHRWFAAAGYETVAASVHNEGEGDFLHAGDLVLGAHGFRSDPVAQREVERLFGRPVVSLELVDPRFYHLDTALCVLDDQQVAYYPGAFSAASRAVLRRLFPDAVLADEQDAAVLGLNAVSDGRHVFLTAAATGLREQLTERGFVPVPIELSELLKAGGSVKCCTLELHP